MDSVYFKPFVSCHKFLEDVHEDSMQNSKSASRFLCNRPNGPLKASGRLIVSRSFSVEDVWTPGQHCPDASSSLSNFYSELDFSQHLFGKVLQDVRTTWQLVWTISRIPKYFRFPLQGRKQFQRRPSGRLAKPSGRIPVMGRIALFWKGSRRRPSGRGYLPSGRSTARVRI
jgi:hypothetical protein